MVGKKEVDSGNDIYGNPIKRIQYEIKQIKVRDEDDSCLSNVSYMKMSCIELNKDLFFSSRCSKAQTATLTWSSPRPHLQCVGWRIWTLAAKRSTSSQVKACRFSAAVVFWSNKCTVLPHDAIGYSLHSKALATWHMLHSRWSFFKQDRSLQTMT